LNLQDTFVAFDGGNAADASPTTKTAKSKAFTTKNQETNDPSSSYHLFKIHHLLKSNKIKAFQSRFYSIKSAACPEVHTMTSMEVPRSR
jgi:hypothetical protein